jgi:hypothetical protein
MAENPSRPRRPARRHHRPRRQEPPTDPAPAPAPAPALPGWAGALASGLGWQGPLDDLADAARAGLRWFRLVPPRSRIHTAAGLFDWAVFDRQVAAVLALGATPYLSLVGSCRRDSSIPQASDWATLFPVLGTLDRPGGWLEYVDAATRRLRQLLSAAGRPQEEPLFLGLWNEPGPGAGRPDRFRNGPREFAVLARETAATVRAADPRVVLAGAEFRAASLLTPGGWEERLLAEPGLATLFDGIAVHIIPPRADPAEVLDKAARLLPRLRALGVPPETPVLLTEVGASSSLRFGVEGYRGEQGQARWLREVLPRLRALGYAAGCWALLRDGAGYPLDGAYGRNGLYTSREEGLQRKPALEALVDLLNSQELA